MTVSYDLVENNKALSFLRRSSAQNEQIAISDASFWLGAFDELHGLIGVVGINHTKNTARIKAFFIGKAFRNKGIGRKLLNYAMFQNDITKYIFKSKSKVTVFSSENSRKLFKEIGFKTMRKQANKIDFMELILNE